MGDAPDRVGEVQRLFLRHADVLEGFILALLPDFSASKDVLHEVFLTATGKASEFRPGSDFLAWTRAIARLKVLEHARRRKGRVRLLGPEALEAVAASAPTADRWSVHREALAACLERVAPRARQILELRYSEPLLSPGEIAARISWSGGAVRVALARARKFLLDCARRRMAGQEA